MSLPFKPGDRVVDTRTYSIGTVAAVGGNAVGITWDGSTWTGWPDPAYLRRATDADVAASIVATAAMMARHAALFGGEA